MRIAVIDNYDSFTYNLVHLLREHPEVELSIFRNDKFQISDLEEYDKILLSPGPGIPSEAGLLMETIATYAGKKPILGICLGHQAIGEYFGGQLENLSEVYHGIQSEIEVNTETSLFKDMKDKIKVGRYHSWIISQQKLPECLQVIAKDSEGQIMAIQHQELNILGMQFHPESVLTPEGKEMINNWINL